MGRPKTRDPLLSALRDAGYQVREVEVSAVPMDDDTLLLSATEDDGTLLSAEVCEGDQARSVERAMDMFSDGS